MAGKKMHELTEGKGSWSYPERSGSFTLGALRLIQVKPLLSKERPRIVLYEFPESVLQCIQVMGPLCQYMRPYPTFGSCPLQLPARQTLALYMSLLKKTGRTRLAGYV